MALLAVNRTKLLRAASLIDEAVIIPVKLNAEMQVKDDMIIIGGVKLSTLEALELAYRIIMTVVNVERCRETK